MGLDAVRLCVFRGHIAFRSGKVKDGLEGLGPRHPAQRQMLRGRKAHANWQPRGGGDSPAPYLSQDNQALKSGIRRPMEASAPCPYEVKVATEKAHETGLAGRYANAVFE